MDCQKTIEAFKRNGYKVSYFETKEQATEYLAEAVRGYRVGFGDSATLMDMGLAQKLSEFNEIIDPSVAQSSNEFIYLGQKALNTEIFFTSVNGASQTGEIVNIDGTGNRGCRVSLRA